MAPLSYPRRTSYRRHLAVNHIAGVVFVGPTRTCRTTFSCLACQGPCTSIFHFSFNTFRSLTQSTTALVSTSLAAGDEDKAGLWRSGKCKGVGGGGRGGEGGGGRGVERGIGLSIPGGKRRTSDEWRRSLIPETRPNLYSEDNSMSRWNPLAVVVFFQRILPLSLVFSSAKCRTARTTAYHIILVARAAGCWVYRPRSCSQYILLCSLSLSLHRSDRPTDVSAGLCARRGAPSDAAHGSSPHSGAYGRGTEHGTFCGSIRVLEGGVHAPI